MSETIVTHDLDNLGVKDHYFDLRIIRALGLNVIGLAKRNVSLRECFTIFGETCRSFLLPGYDSWYCLDEWLALEAEKDITSTWFVACSKGLGVSYSKARAAEAVEQILQAGHAVGLHSQVRDNLDALPGELEIFRKAYSITGPVPVRFHYLLKPGDSIEKYRDLIAYSSSTYNEETFSTSEDFERPIDIMDTYFFSPINQNLTLEQAKTRTREILDAARKENKNMIVDLHQRSLSKCFPRYREYILWFYGSFLTSQP